MAPISAMLLAAALGSGTPRIASAEPAVTADDVRPVAVAPPPPDEAREEPPGGEDVTFLTASGSIVFTDGAPRTFVVQDREHTSRHEQERP